MTVASTPSEAAYIAAQGAYAAGEALTAAALTAGVICAIVLGIASLWLWHREIKAQAKCGPHKFEARSDHIFDTAQDKWRTIYVRDVCTHCGDTREREPGEPEVSA